MSSKALPLSGVLVVALEQAVAAPACTVRLADAGARVIKVERPEGDFARGYDDYVKGEATYFVWAKRGMRNNGRKIIEHSIGDPSRSKFFHQFF